MSENKTNIPEAELSDALLDKAVGGTSDAEAGVFTCNCCEDNYDISEMSDWYGICKECFDSGRFQPVTRHRLTYK